MRVLVSLDSYAGFHGRRVIPSGASHPAGAALIDRLHVIHLFALNYWRSVRVAGWLEVWAAEGERLVACRAI